MTLTVEGFLVICWFVFFFFSGMREITQIFHISSKKKEKRENTRKNV